MKFVLENQGKPETNFLAEYFWVFQEKWVSRQIDCYATVWGTKKGLSMFKISEWRRKI